MSRIVNYFAQEGYTVSVDSKRYRASITNAKEAENEEETGESSAQETPPVEFSLELYFNEKGPDQQFNIYSAEFQKTAGDYFAFQGIYKQYQQNYLQFSA
jgi:hypothetical protein